ncbi:MAG: hypothetical protein SCALA702_12540 [Melioribacteraceae bacterium]|nr:MAG: hypothetical protein SCALA702_12540 [Melioribacteraceae bacterium]
MAGISKYFRLRYNYLRIPAKQLAILKAAFYYLGKKEYFNDILIATYNNLPLQLRDANLLLITQE